MRGRRDHVLPLFCLLAALLPPLTAAGAGAGPTVRGGLTLMPNAQLAAMSGRVRVAASPDGRRVYFIGGFDNRSGVAIFQRNATTGALSRGKGPESCIVTEIAASQCRKGPWLNNSFALAVSPDSQDVVVGSYAGSTGIALYRRTPGGGLTYVPTGGVTGRGVSSSYDFAFSPDGKNVYAAEARNLGALLVLDRNPATGTLSEHAGATGCFERSGHAGSESPPCSAVPNKTFSPSFVRVSPDGGTVVVYAGGFYVFKRDPATGTLTLLGCQIAQPTAPCVALTPGIPTFPDDMAYAPDGSTLIVVSTDSGTDDSRLLGRVDLLHVDPATGAVTETACIEDEVAGCNHDVKVPDGATAVAISPDGQTAYIGGSLKLRAYRIGTTGLTPLAGMTACISADASKGCTHLGAAAVQPFDGFRSLTVTADGRSLYSAGEIGLAFAVSP